MTTKKPFYQPKQKPLTQTDLRYLAWQEEQRIAAQSPPKKK